MGNPHPIALRERVVAFVEGGNLHRPAAVRFRDSVKFVNDMVILKRETDGLAPGVQGHGSGHGKLVDVGDWITARKPDSTLNDLIDEPADHHCIAIHRASVRRFLRGLGLTHRKDLHVISQELVTISAVPSEDHASMV